MLSTIGILLLLVLAVEGFNATLKTNVAVYWGQDSTKGEKPLAYYCDSSDVDIIILTRIAKIPGPNNIPVIDFGSHCNETFEDGLRNCSQIGIDIDYCQKKGKLILISFGDDSTTAYNFGSDVASQTKADLYIREMWKMFGPSTNSSIKRPFGTAVVDGFDIDISPDIPSSILGLLYGATKAVTGETSRKYYLSETYHCNDLGIFSRGSYSVDYAFVQFYNRECSLDKKFNWESVVHNLTRFNPTVKIFLGIPASTDTPANVTGYVDSLVVNSTLTSIGNSTLFGGISLWDAYSAFTHKDKSGVMYVNAMKKILEHDYAPPVPPPPPPSNSSYQDCTRLIGIALAKCYNHNFANGYYLGNGTSCTSGEIAQFACSPSKDIAECNHGKWSLQHCGNDTICYAYTEHDTTEVKIGCNFANDYPKFS